jgi:hypothetical protein
MNIESVSYKYNYSSETQHSISITGHHKMTLGPSFLEHITKVVNACKLQLKDFFLSYYNSNLYQKKLIENKLEESVLNKNSQGATLFLNRTIKKEAPLLSNIDVSEYSGIIKNKYQNNITLMSGFGSNKTIDKIQPSKIIPIKSNKNSPNLIFYPFVYPAKNWYSYDHIVLIAIDKKKKEIIYYDAQGLSSDDDQRKNIFTDDLNFDMRTDLVNLGKSFFKDEKFTISENRNKHQTDPYNCGVYTLSMMESLSKGLNFKEACEELGKESGSILRTRLGDNCMDYYKGKT